MVVQCPECRTRFRFPEERMKPSGVKAKCARCMHIFLVTEPAPQPPTPEAANDAEPAGSEGVFTGTAGADVHSPAEPPPLGQDDFPPFSDDEPQSFQDAAEEEAPAEDDFAFDPLPEQKLAQEPAEDFPVANEHAESPQAPLDALGDTPFDDGFEEGDAVEEDKDLFGFDDGTEAATDVPEDDFAFEEEQRPSAGEDFDDEFAFEPSASAEAMGDFTFEQSSVDAEHGDDFAFEGAGADSDDEFGFDDDPRDDIDPFAPAGRNALQDDFPLEGNAALDPSSDFDDRDFTAEDSDDSRHAGDDRGALEFGRMDFSTAATADKPPSPFAAAPPSPPLVPPLGGLQGGEPAPAPEKPAAAAKGAESPKKRSSMGVLLAVVLIFLVGLVALAGYFAWQGGPQEMMRILDRAGVQKAPVAPAGQIRLSDLRGYFAQNAEAGQIFVVTGQAINEFQQARSAVAIKGVLFNAQGEALMQQTVFAGNPFTEEELRTLSFQSLEERMNNQFGEGLSNLNVVPGRAIPFAIVFRELPDNLAEFTVEVTDSRPGSGS